MNIKLLFALLMMLAAANTYKVVSVELIPKPYAGNYADCGGVYELLDPSLKVNNR